MLREIISPQNYRNTEPRSNRVPIFIIIIILLIGLLFLFSKQFTNNENYFAKVYQNLIGVTKKSFYSNNLQLRDNNAALEKQIAQLKMENLSLKQGIISDSPQPYDIISADLLYEINPIWRNLSRVNKGSDQGVRIGNIAINNNLVYGVVNRVSVNTSELASLFDPSLALPAQISGVNQAGILNYSPNLGLTLTINEIKNSDADKMIGKEVITVASNNSPAGFIIGKIGDYYSNQGQSQWKVIPELKDLDLSQVSIIINN